MRLFSGNSCHLFCVSIVLLPGQSYIALYNAPQFLAGGAEEQHDGALQADGVRRVLVVHRLLCLRHERGILQLSGLRAEQLRILGSARHRPGPADWMPLDLFCAKKGILDLGKVEPPLPTPPLTLPCPLTFNSSSLVLLRV